MKSKYKKIICFLLFIFLAPLGFYFTITSNVFLTKAVAPVVGYLIKADVIVKSAEYDPFTSCLKIYDTKVGDKNNYFISAKSASFYIDILSLFKNRLKLRDLCIDEIDLNFIKDRKGKWSLPWLNIDASTVSTTSANDDSSEFLLDFSNVNVSNLNINFKNNLSKTPLCVKLKNFNLNTDHFKNGLLSLIKYNGEIQIVFDEIEGIDKGNINGELSVNLDSHYLPSHMSLSTFFSDLFRKEGELHWINRVVNFKTDARRQRNGTHCYDIISEGKLSLSDIQIAADNYPLGDDVSLELFLDNSLNLDFSKKTVSVKKMKSTLSINNKSIFSSNLDTPFIFNYAKAQFLGSDIVPLININSKNMNLKLLNVFMKKKVRIYTGKLNSDLTLSINPYNNDIILKGNTDIENLSFELNDYKPVDLTKDQRLNFNIKSDINFNITGKNKFQINNFNFTSKQPKYEVGSTFILKEPFLLELKQKKIIPDKDIKVELTVNKFHLTDFVEYIPKSFPLKLNDGYLRYKYLFTVPKTFNSLVVEGNAELLYSNFSFYGKPVNNLSISNKINALFYDVNRVNVEECVTGLYVNGVMGFLAKTTGRIHINEKKDSTLTMSVENINKYFFDLFSNNISKNIAKLRADGKIFFDYTELGEKTSVKGDFILSEAILGNKTDTQKELKVSGGLKFNIVETANDINLNKFNLSLIKEDVNILDFDLNGSFPIPVKNGVSNLTVRSDSLAFDEVVKIFDVLLKDNKKGKEKTVAVSAKEYEHIDFKELDLKCDISLNKIFCGDLIKSVYHGKLDINDNIISLRNEVFKVNGTDIKFYGNIETGYSDGYPYKLRTEFKSLDLNPIIETFVSGKYKKTKGTVDKFSLSLQGKGFTKKNLDKNLVGVLSIKLKQLSLPYQIGEYKLLKIMLLPFDLLIKLREMLPGGLLVNNLKKGIESTADIFTNKDNINLAAGEIRLIAKNGKVDLKKIHFAGEKNDTVKYSNFYGTVDYDGILEIKADSNISHIKLPINIYGTVEKPLINYPLFIKRFLTVNTINILNPMNIIDLMMDAGKGISNTLEETRKTIVKPFNEED